VFVSCFFAFSADIFEENAKASFCFMSTQNFDLALLCPIKMTCVLICLCAYEEFFCLYFLFRTFINLCGDLQFSRIVSSHLTILGEHLLFQCVPSQGIMQLTEYKVKCCVRGSGLWSARI
jgi:hypothetical protein